MTSKEEIAVRALLFAVEEIQKLTDNLWEAVPWGKTFNLDVARLNTAPGNLEKVVREVTRLLETAQ